MRDPNTKGFALQLNIGLSNIVFNSYPDPDPDPDPDPFQNPVSTPGTMYPCGQSQQNGCRPLKSTRRHGPFYVLVTCDRGVS